MSGNIDRHELKKIRKRTGLSQTEFARKVGYSESYIQKLEQGQLPVTKEFCENMQKAFDLELAYRRACLSYGLIEEKHKKINWGLPKRAWIFLIILVLIFVLLY